MSRRAARTDANHARIRTGLRTVPGVTVRDCSHVGGGFPDLLVGYRKRTILMEVKDGAKAASARKLTPAQVAFHAGWTGSPIWVVETLDQALDIVLKEGAS